MIYNLLWFVNIGEAEK